MKKGSSVAKFGALFQIIPISVRTDRVHENQPGQRVSDPGPPEYVTSATNWTAAFISTL